MTQPDKLSVEEVELQLRHWKELDSITDEVPVRCIPMAQQLLDIMRENERLKEALEHIGWLLDEASPSDDAHSSSCYYSAQKDVKEALQSCKHTENKDGH